MKVKILNKTVYCLENEFIGKVVEATMRRDGLVEIEGRHIGSTNTLCFYEGEEVEVMNEDSEADVI